MIIRLFTAHPETVGENYFTHLFHASTFGVKMLGGGIACILHGLFPFWCTTTGSDCVKKLHGKLSGRRRTAAHHDEQQCWSI